MGENLILEHNDKIAFHPGIYIKDNLDELDMTQKELATRLDTSTKTVSELVNGITSVSPNIAFKLSNVLDVDTQTWLNIQSKYDVMKLEIEESQKLEDQKDILKLIDYPKLVKQGIVTANRKSEKKIKELCSTLKIASLDVLKEQSLSINFRSMAIEKESHIINTNLWIEMVSIQLAQKQYLEFDRDKLANSINYLRSLTTLNQDEFLPKIESILEKCGIHFILMPSIPNAKPKGMVMWRDNKITLAMSNKGKYADIFWFTFFHEIGHILLHPNSNFVELDGKDKKENEADSFASKILIPEGEYQIFVGNSDYSLSAIQDFAKSIDISTTIVIGRLQNDKLISYSYLTDHKDKFTW